MSYSLRSIHNLHNTNTFFSRKSHNTQTSFCCAIFVEGRNVYVVVSPFFKICDVHSFRLTARVYVSSFYWGVPDFIKFYDESTQGSTVEEFWWLP